MNTWLKTTPTENKYSITMLVQCPKYTLTHRGVYVDGIWCVYEYPDESSYVPLNGTERVVAWCDVDKVPDWAKVPLPAI